VCCPAGDAFILPLEDRDVYRAEELAAHIMRVLRPASAHLLDRRGEAMTGMEDVGFLAKKQKISRAMKWFMSGRRSSRANLVSPAAASQSSLSRLVARMSNELSRICSTVAMPGRGRKKPKLFGKSAYSQATVSPGKRPSA
jgi:hypothetical protein